MLNCNLFNSSKIVGKDIKSEDIIEFYYTKENINYGAYFLRYRFYVDGGKHMFFHEYRERKDDYGPTTEKDRTTLVECKLNDAQWAEFFRILKDGTVNVRKDNAESGGTGPWLFLYWKGDKEKYREYTFASFDLQKRFEQFCEVLTKENQSKQTH